MVTFTSPFFMRIAYIKRKSLPKEKPGDVFRRNLELKDINRVISIYSDKLKELNISEAEFIFRLKRKLRP